MPPDPLNPGYHLATIPKGELGELSKLSEEALEALDAQAQDAQVMVLVELADLAGALDAYLARHAPAGLPTLPDPPALSAPVTVLDIAGHFTGLAASVPRQGLPPAHPDVLEALARGRALVERYLAAHHPSIGWDDLATMATITARAFRSGRRT